MEDPNLKAHLDPGHISSCRLQGEHDVRMGRVRNPKSTLCVCGRGLGAAVGGA